MHDSSLAGMPFADRVLVGAWNPMRWPMRAINRHSSDMVKLDWITVRTPEMEHGLDEEV